MRIPRHSALKPSGEVEFTTWVRTAPRSLKRCTASISTRISGVTSHIARRYEGRSTASTVRTGSMVDKHRIGRRRWQLPLVKHSTGPCHCRPCACVGCRFAGEVAGFEFREGGVDVFEIEQNPCHDPLVSVDLDDAEKFDLECLRSILARDTRTTEVETIAACRNDGRRNIRQSHV